jgi:AcrR family transcriptional regulator
MHAQTDNLVEETRQRILQAAIQRFTQFGYNKTTMAEIARDCEMSAANLYRFFDNKLDIGAQLASGCLGAKLDLLRDIAQQSQPAAERLRELVLQSLQFTHEQWAENPLINEMVNAICGERMDIVANYKAGEHRLLVTLLQDGVQRGEFAVADVDDAATGIATAMTAFNLPLLMPMYPLEEFQERAQSVVRLMLEGLLMK